MTDAVIHRVSEDVGGVVCSVTEGQWIATGLRPRDDKGEGDAWCLSLRGGREDDAAIHCMQSTRSDNSVRLPVPVDRHGLSALAMTI